jgi:hypothetical protein
VDARLNQAGALGYRGAVTDGPRLSLAGRVVLALAVLLALAWSGSAQPGTTGAPPALVALRATPELPHGTLGGPVHLVGPVARHGQRNRSGSASLAVLGAALAVTVVAASRRWRAARPRRLDRRLLALRPRAPPCCRL